MTDRMGGGRHQLLFITHLPTRRNDGSPVEPAELQAIVQEFWQRFGGCNIDRQLIEGHWVDPETGEHYADEVRPLRVECDPGRVNEAEAMVRAVGKPLGQKVMYFEVRYFDGIRFLRVDDG